MDSLKLSYWNSEKLEYFLFNYKYKSSPHCHIIIKYLTSHFVKTTILSFFVCCSYKNTCLKYSASIKTIVGHQNRVTYRDCLNADRCVPECNCLFVTLQAVYILYHSATTLTHKDSFTSSDVQWGELRVGSASFLRRNTDF